MLDAAVAAVNAHGKVFHTFYILLRPLIGSPIIHMHLLENKLYLY